MASVVGRAHLVAKSSLRSLAAFAVAGRQVANFAPHIDGSGQSLFSSLNPFSNVTNNANNVKAKNVVRGFAAEAEPVAAAGKGAITQVRSYLLRTALSFFFSLDLLARLLKKEEEEIQTQTKLVSSLLKENESSEA